MQTDCGHTGLPRNVIQVCRVILSVPRKEITIQKCSDAVIAFYEVQPVEVLNEDTYHVHYVQVYINTERVHFAIIKLA